MQDSLIPYLIVIIKVLETGIFSDVWKKSFVIPIHKSRDKYWGCSYGPVTVISAIPKIFESIVYEEIYRSIEKKIIP